jgi:glucose-1-phosphate thymidylyltransferase
VISACCDAAEHVANKPIVYHVLDVLVEAGVEEVVVASSSEFAPAIKECLAGCEHRQRLSFVHRSAPVDLGEAIRLAAPRIGMAPCIVHVANGLYGEPLAPLLEHLQGDSPDLLVTIKPGPASSRHLSPTTQRMLRLAELHPETSALSLAGLCLFGIGALHAASTAMWNAADEADLTGVADRIAAVGGKLCVLPGNAWRQYAGAPLDLLELNRIALDRLTIERHSASDGDNRIEGRVSIDRAAFVRASVIVGPAVIGPGARITDAYIGPYTSIGADARIEGAEVERSIIASGASITHVGGRLVASVVGRDARVFRDFSLPRALRLRVGDGTEVALC